MQRLKQKLEATSSNTIHKEYCKEITSGIVTKHVNLIKTTEGAILRVQSDPRTFEMRRDIQPELK